MEEGLKTAGILLPLLMLSAGTWTDIREKRVDVRPILLAGLAGIAIRIIVRDESIPVLLAALAPGMLLLAVALTSRGGVGTGDGLCVLVLGLYFSPEEVLMILFAALCFGGVIGAIFLFRGRGRGYAFPFLPCLLGGCLCCEIARILLQR
jgi:leader peptidase (prepilin peptidase)/N-methyltransferase